MYIPCVGDVVEQTVTCGPTVKGRKYVVGRNYEGSDIFIIRPPSAIEYCHCTYNWKFVSKATLESRYANK